MLYSVDPVRTQIQWAKYLLPEKREEEGEREREGGKEQAEEK